MIRLAVLLLAATAGCYRDSSLPLGGAVDGAATPIPELDGSTIHDGKPVSLPFPPFGHPSSASVALGEVWTSAAADFNSDGLTDLVVGSWTGGAATVLLGDGKAGLSVAARLIPSNGIEFSQSVRVEDLDGNGTKDIIVASQTATLRARGQLEIYLGNGDGSFERAGNYAAGASGKYCCAVVDLDGDGLQDIVHVDGDLLFLRGVGRGNFQVVSGLPVQGGLRGIVAADLDHDNQVDLVAQRVGGALAILSNHQGELEERELSPSVGELADPALLATDIDGDSWVDVISAGQTARGEALLQLFKNEQGGGLRLASEHLMGGTPLSWLVAGDFNSDGLRDVAATGLSVRGQVVFLMNNGPGGFVAAPPLEVSEEPSSLAVGDFWRDGLSDLVVTAFSQPTVVLYRQVAQSR